MSLRAGVLALLVLPLLVAPLVIVTDADARPLDEIRRDLSAAQAELADLEERLEATVDRFSQIEVTVAEVEAERDDLERRLRQLREEYDALADLVSFRVREAFKHGSTLDPFAVFLASEDPNSALDRASTVQRVNASDQASTEELAAARARLQAAEERLEERTSALEAALEEQQQLADQLEADFERAQEVEASLTAEEREEVARIEAARRERERRERERRERELREQQAAAAADSGGGGGGSSGGGSSGGGDAPAPSTGGGGMVCPLDQPRHFTDTWGAARSGGRAHRGTDIMGPRGIPVRAITSGTWQIQRQGASAGLWGILRGDDGDHYWYMHLDSHTVSNGARVSAGTQVGTNGSTGNATAGAEHVHFEHHPGGGGAVNPYGLLRRVCG